MAKLYLNFRGSQGVETVNEYDLSSTPHPRDVSLALKENKSRVMTNRRIHRWIAQHECTEANRQEPGHYLSTRCTAAWRSEH